MADRPPSQATQTTLLVVVEVLKVQVATLQERQVQLMAELDDLCAKINNGLTQRQALMHQRIESICRVGTWAGGILAALIVILITYGVSQLWQTRDTVQRLERELPAPPAKQLQSPRASPPKGYSDEIPR